MARRVSFLDRGSISSKTTGRHSLWGRDMMGLGGDELDQFDSSLGCPLSSYEEATLSLVGSKALQCWRLTQFGLPIPTSFIVPTYVYSLHIQEAGVEKLIKEVFSSDLRKEDVRESAKPKLEEIQEKIKKTPLLPEVVENLEAFVDTLPDSATFAVRSSGSAEGT